MTQFLFAYGFLKKSLRCNPELKAPDIPGKWIGTGCYSGKMYMVDSYPGVKYSNIGSDFVIGEVLLLKKNPFFLKEMDEYEMSKPLYKKWPYEYVRKKREVIINNRMVNCWVYEYALPVKTFSRILSGNFQMKKELILMKN
ncbi:MAG: gamma-glutamylcyclotransferase [Cyclobacteriaceae bacterium]